MRTETGASILSHDNKDSNAFDFYEQYFRNLDDPAALRTIQAPAWVDSPEIRGTSAILWSCILTLIACVYTALHLNIPPKGGFWRILAIKIRWVITALLVPEIMIYMSIMQFLRARRLRRDLIEVLQDSQKNGKMAADEGRQLPIEVRTSRHLQFWRHHIHMSNHSHRSIYVYASSSIWEALRLGQVSVTLDGTRTRNTTRIIRAHSWKSRGQTTN